MMTAVSPSLFVFAKDIMEQYADPIFVVTVAMVFRSYRRIVVDGGKNEKMPAAITPIVTRTNRFQATSIPYPGEDATARWVSSYEYPKTKAAVTHMIKLVIGATGQ